MKTFLSMTGRNIKLFFRDKGMFFTSLITPLILLVLFITFLGNVYRDSFNSCVPQGVTVPESLVDGFVGGWLFSSLLAVCCVTVAFCSNLLMVLDKTTGARGDLTVSPLKKSTLALSYYVSTVLTTLIICAVALIFCFIYLWKMGWYLSVADVLLAILDIFLLVMFGTALSSVVNHFLNTQGQMSAVSAIISAGYGFICGAYMPISQFSEGIQKFISFLPGTYGTSLLHNHLMRGVFKELEENYLPPEAVAGLRTAFDSDLYFGKHNVTTAQMYLVVVGSVIILIALYVLLTGIKKRSKG